MHHPEDLLVGNYARYCAIVSIIIAGLGFIGNGMCIRMMLNYKVKEFSCSVFLLALCMTDTIVLVYEVMDDIAELIPDYSVFDLLYGNNQWRCRFGVFFYESSKIISAWLVVALSVELFMAAVSPGRRVAIYSRKRATYVTLAVGLIGVAGCFPFLVISTPPDSPDGGPQLGSCTSNYRVFYAVYTWFVLRATAQTAVPFFFVIGCNVASILLLPRKKHIKYMTSGPLSGSGASHMQDDGKVRQHFQAKSVILAISFAYCVAAVPAGTLQTLLAVETFQPTFQLLPKQQWYSAYYITQTILLLAYSCKFYLLILLGPEFRAAMGVKRSTLERADQMGLEYVANGSAPRQQGHGPQFRNDTF